MEKGVAIIRIKYNGHSCFSIQSNKQILLTDPCDYKVGYRIPDETVSIVTISHGHYDHNAVEVLSNPSIVVQSCGEGVIGDFHIQGIPSYHDDNRGALRGENIIYKISAEGQRIVHMGDIGHFIEKEKLGVVDVLLIPVGGVFTIDAKQAVKMIEELSPRIIIPMHFRTEQSIYQQLAPVEEFLSCWKGNIIRENQSEIVTSLESLPEQSTVIVLEV